MPTRLLLAPVGTGKTEYLLDHLAQTVRRGSFDRVWVLVPTERQEIAFRQRLIGRDQVYFNVEFFNFYKLYTRLLDMAGQPQRQLDDTARFRLLRSILDRLRGVGQLAVYHTIADTPGFVKIVGEFIYELKQNLVYPEVFERAIQASKDRDLSLIYNHYQETLRKHDLVDREGQGWLALSEVEGQRAIGRDVELLLVDGYDQFTPLQARLIALLGSRARETIVTLPTVPDREETVGRRFSEALTRLREAHEPGALVVETMPPYTEGRPPALKHLVENGFRSGSPTRSADDSLIFLEAPDIPQEVAAILRRVKRLLLETGCRPDDILIAVRDWERYGAHFAALGRVYGVPLALHYGEPLADNPAIIALLNLLDLPGSDFLRRAFLDGLRSPYFAIPDLAAEQVIQLEQIAHTHLVVGGRAAWLEGVDAALRPPKSDDERPLVTLNPDEVAGLKAALIRFFAAVTPPESATVGDYVRWLERLIGPDVASDPDDSGDGEGEHAGYTLGMLGQVRQEASNPAIQNRDLVALRQLKLVLRSLLAAQNLFITLGEDANLTWPVFLSDLKRAIGQASLNPAANRSGRVLVTSVADARGLPHHHVLIPGLSEGLFPAPAAENPLYLDTERRDLKARGVFLETQAERAADEGLFYELVSLAQGTLTLSRPTVQNGAFWPESHLWRAARVLFADVQDIITRYRIPIGKSVAADEAASLDEAAIAAAEGLNDPTPTPGVIALYNWLIARHPYYWGQIRLGRTIERRRMSTARHDAYSGRLTDAHLIKWVRAELSAGRVWSASQFNDYGLCGFRFFAKRLLKLEALEEPEDGLQAAQLGSINHKILEDTYRWLAEAGVTIAPENSDLALDRLRQVAAVVLRDAPGDYHFHASALWEQEKVTVLRKLEALVRLDVSADGPVIKAFGDTSRRPYRLETPFGADGQHLEITLDDRVGGLRVQGYIDRIDRQGDGLILMDYKTGSTPIKTEEMERGRNFQMMLYLLVAQQLLEHLPDADPPKRVAGGLFWHLRSQKSSGVIRLDEAGQASIQAAREHLSQHIQRGRAGDFAVHPNKLERGKCSHYCDFSQFCRVSITQRSKA
jgi:ATP-dependent helicase/DNAse subunit B